MNRRTVATQRLRDRLRQSDGVLASIERDGETLVHDILIVPIDVSRAVRSESEFLLEDGDCAFLIGSDCLEQPPEIGDAIRTATTEYRVTERPELEVHWRWHDRSEVQRIVFAKEWKSAE